MGSSGWLRSVLAGASGIAAASAGHEAVPRRASEFPWDAEYLVFSVREPWPSKTSGASITFGKVTRESPLVLVSQMPENGVVFSDGIEADLVEFNAGTSATVSGLTPGVTHYFTVTSRTVYTDPSSGVVTART